MHSSPEVPDESTPLHHCVCSCPVFVATAGAEQYSPTLYQDMRWLNRQLGGAELTVIKLKAEPEPASESEDEE